MTRIHNFQFTKSVHEWIPITMQTSVQHWEVKGDPMEIRSSFGVDNRGPVGRRLARVWSGGQMVGKRNNLLM